MELSIGDECAWLSCTVRSLEGVKVDLKFLEIFVNFSEMVQLKTLKFLLRKYLDKTQLFSHVNFFCKKQKEIVVCYQPKKNRIIDYLVPLLEKKTKNNLGYHS